MPTFQDYIEYIKSGQQYLEEASYNNIDITDLNHESDYNSKSIIIDSERTLDELNKNFFETLNNFKVNYVKYYLDRFETCLDNSNIDIINTDEISGKYETNKTELDNIYDQLLYLKYRIIINLKALDQDISASEISEAATITNYNNKFENLTDLNSAMKELLNDKTFLYNSKLIYIFNLSLAGILICYVIYKKYSYT